MRMQNFKIDKKVFFLVKQILKI